MLFSYVSPEAASLSNVRSFYFTYFIVRARSHTPVDKSIPEQDSNSSISEPSRAAYRTDQSGIIHFADTA